MKLRFQCSNVTDLINLNLCLCTVFMYTSYTSYTDYKCSFCKYQYVNLRGLIQVKLICCSEQNIKIGERHEQVLNMSTVLTDHPESPTAGCIRGDGCQANKCQNGATCIDMWTHTICHCVIGYKGTLSILNFQGFPKYIVFRYVQHQQI